MKKHFVFITDVHAASFSAVRTGDLMEDILNKLKFVVDYANKHDASILIGGDLFDKPSVPDIVKSGIGKVLQQATNPIYSIWGNHDQLYSTHDKDDKTSYNLFSQFGIIRDLKTVDFGEFILTSEKPLQSIGKPQLAMFHGFLNQEDKGWECMFTDIATTDQALVLLGHDHVQYEAQEFGPVRVVRPGSFLRKTREEASMRQPQLVHILVNTEDPQRVFKIKYVPIATARDCNTIFKTKSATKSAADEATYQDIINSLMTVTDEDMTLMDAVAQVGTEEDVAYIKQVYDEVTTEKENK